MSGMGYRGARFYRETDEKPHITKALIFRIASYFKPYWKLVSIMLVAIIITSALGVIPAVFTKSIIDIALPDENLKLLVILILLSLATQITTGLIAVGQSYLNTLISKSIIRDLRMGMYEHLQGMSLKFFSDVKPGEITSRMNNDIGGIESVFSNTFIRIIQGFFVFLTTAITLFYTNWQLAIVSLLTLPLFIAPTRKVGKARWRIASKAQAKLAELTTIVAETLNVNGTMLIKLFTKEKAKNKEFEQINQEVTALGIQEKVVGRWFMMTLQTFSSIGPMLIYLLGGIILVINHSITVGGIVMFVSLLGRLYGPVNSFANIHVDTVRSLALFERIFQYFDMKSEIAEKENARTFDQIEGHIRFENVSFGYTNHHATLKGVSLQIRAGQMAAFVGPSGAGKTTITYLLPRLYDATAGHITIDGIPIQDMTLHSLRSQIGMVTQDTYLFNTSIRENLLFAKGNATESELIRVCQMAHIHDFISSLPEGYDTIVGDRGIKLSGGEKQRISIARTLLKDPKIVIFDEATSALDSTSETLVQQAVEPLLKSRTSLVIAHRLSTVISADVIFVVQNGMIVEYGKHTDLLQKNGVYKTLYDTQFKSTDNEHLSG